MRGVETTVRYDSGVRIYDITSKYLYRDSGGLGGFHLDLRVTRVTAESQARGFTGHIFEIKRKGT